MSSSSYFLDSCFDVGSVNVWPCRRHSFEGCGRAFAGPLLGSAAVWSSLFRMIALMSFMPYAVAAGPSPLDFMREVASGGASLALEQDVAMVLLLGAVSARRTL